MRRLIYTTILLLYINIAYSQTPTVNATIELSGNAVTVLYTSTGVIDNPTLNPNPDPITEINVWVRITNASLSNTSLSVSSNPFVLALSPGTSLNPNPRDLGSDVLYRFGSPQAIGDANSAFPVGIPVEILGLTLTTTGSPTSVQLVVSSTSPGTGSTGTNLKVGDNFNALIWPSGSGLRPMDEALPIRLQSFTAQKLGINSALLNWKSASEENASHFEIEKSMDAETWAKIGKEETRGSLNYGAEYSFRDEEALMIRNNENTVYYRLKMVDLDGSYEYSDIRLVTFDRNLGAAEAYPNPSFEFFNWKMSVGDTQENDAQLHLFDMTGKLVKKQIVSANGISKVDIAELETGLYNIVVKHGDEVYRKRIIKTN